MSLPTQSRVRTSVREQKTALVGAAFCVALSAVSLILFRGPISILSAFFIPSAILIFSANQGRAYYGLTSAGLMMFTFFFFLPQTFFVLGYILLAQVFRILFLKNHQKLSFLPLSVITALLFSSLILFLGILLGEGLLVLIINLLFLSALYRRLPTRFAS